MAHGSDIARYAAIAAAPFAGQPENLIQDLARLIGEEGLTCEEAADALELDARHVKDALALIPQFASLVDVYRAQAVREHASRATKKLGDALLLGELTEGEARLFRAALAEYREVRAGERETERRKPKSKPPRQRHKPTAFRSSIEVEDDRPEGVEIESRVDDDEEVE